MVILHLHNENMYQAFYNVQKMDFFFYESPIYTSKRAIAFSGQCVEQWTCRLVVKVPSSLPAMCKNVELYTPPLPAHKKMDDVLVAVCGMCYSYLNKVPNSPQGDETMYQYVNEFKTILCTVLIQLCVCK